MSYIFKPDPERAKWLRKALGDGLIVVDVEIPKATGDVLDRIGHEIGLERDGESDELYRVRLLKKMRDLPGPGGDFRDGIIRRGK